MTNIIRKPFRYTYVRATWWLIGINVVIFLLQLLFPRIEAYLSLNVQNVLYAHAYWQFFTYMFDHGGWAHIFFNMFALAVFGLPVERRLGTKEFLLFYLLTGVLAGVFSFLVYLVTGAWNVALLGASGALYAVQLAYAVLFPDSRLLLWGIIPMRAPVMVLGFTALEVILSFTGLQAGVAHLTHLAGFAFGWFYFNARFGIHPIKVWRHKQYIR
jgi:membrane associated rhomboid family serine protease